MKIFKGLFALLVSLLLVSCNSSNVREEPILNAAGQHYFKTNKHLYHIASMRVVSANEKKAVSGGLMSTASLQSFVTDRVNAEMQRQGVKGHGMNAVTLKISVSISRVFNWGKASSINSIRYSGVVTLKKDNKILGQYEIGGQVGDRSILGDFKATLGVNSRKSEPKLFQYIVYKIVNRLPR